MRLSISVYCTICTLRVSKEHTVLHQQVFTSLYMQLFVNIVLAAETSQFVCTISNYFFNLLKPKSFCMYHQLEHSTILRSANICVFCVYLRTNSNYFPIQH